MALKRELDSLDDLPEPLHEHYVERDGKYVLDAEIEDTTGLKSALQKERDARRKYEKDLKALTEQYAGIDREEYERLKAEMEQAQQKKMLDEGKLEELLAERVKKMQAEHQKALAELQTSNETLTQTLNRELITNRLQAAALEARIRKEAIPDAVMLGERAFRLVEGTVVAVDPDGTTLYGKEGEPLTMREWFEERHGDRPHWFEASSGGGAGHVNGQGGEPRLSSKPVLKLTDAEKVKLINEIGSDAYLQRVRQAQSAAQGA